MRYQVTNPRNIITPQKHTSGLFQSHVEGGGGSGPQMKGSESLSYFKGIGFYSEKKYSKIELKSCSSFNEITLNSNFK